MVRSQKYSSLQEVINAASAKEHTALEHTTLDTGATLTLIKVGNLKGETYTRKANGPHRRDRSSSKDNQKNKRHGAFRGQENSTYHACHER